MIHWVLLTQYKRGMRELAARGFADGLGAETQLLVEVAYAPHPGALHTRLAQLQPRRHP